MPWDATLVKLTGIGMVRNEADIVATTIAYHLALGCDEILLVDNGSDDGTTEILHRLSQADPRVRWTRDNGPYLQAEIMTGLSRDAWVRGADWVLPFDADEFWWCRTGSLRGLLEGCRAGVLRAGVVNFVQVRGQRRFTPGALGRMTLRAEPVGTILDAAQRVSAGEIAWVQARYPPKVLARPSSDMTLEPGNHEAKRAGALADGIDSDAVAVLHAPLRCRFALRGKAETGRRMAEVYPAPLGWHARRWDALARAGAFDDEWRANSHRRGALDVNGRTVPLVPDDRLRVATAPIVRNAIYQRLAQWCTERVAGPRQRRSKVSR